MSAQIDSLDAVAVLDDDGELAHSEVMVAATLYPPPRRLRAWWPGMSDQVGPGSSGGFRLASATVLDLARAVLFPIAFACLAKGWAVLARPAQPTGEDAVIGFDLLVAALAVQVEFLFGPQPYDGLAHSLLGGTGLAMFATAVAMRSVGYGGLVLLRRGRRICNWTGIFTLIVTFLLIDNPELVYRGL